MRAIDELISSYHDAIGLSECEITDAARAELASLHSASAALSNLLAVIHRDGGQHESAHGTVESARLAERVVVELRERIDRYGEDDAILHRDVMAEAIKHATHNTEMITELIRDRDDYKNHFEACEEQRIQFLGRIAAQAEQLRAAKSVIEATLSMIHSIQSSQKGSIGSIDNVYIPQLYVGQIDSLETNISAWLASTAPAPDEKVDQLNNIQANKAVEEYGEIGAAEVWRSWRDTMIGQGREVSGKFMMWPTVPERDRKLDAIIAVDVVKDFLIWVEAHRGLRLATYPAPDAAPQREGRDA